MTDQISTAAELDALPNGTLFTDRQDDVWIIDTHSRGFNGNETYLIGPETRSMSAEVCVKKWGPLVLRWRPDTPARAEPTEEQVAVQCVWTGVAGYRCPRCGLYVCVPQRPEGVECPRCVVSSFEALGEQIHDAHEEWDGTVERDHSELARAVLALLPQRVAPSEEEIAEAVRDTWDEEYEYVPETVAAAVAALYASQPTVAEVRAQALKDAAHYLRAWGPGMDEAARQIDHLANRRAERGEA